MSLGTYSGGGLGMGLEFTLVDSFSPVADKIEARMRSLTATVNDLNAELGRAAQTINSQITIGTRAVNSATHTAHDMLAQQYINLELANRLWDKAKGFMSSFIESAAVDSAFQRYELGLQTFVGSAEKANRLLRDITQDAIENPRFEVEGMLKANQRLVAMGEDAEFTRRMITNLTSILAGTGGGNAELNRASIALEKVASAGQLSQRHMLSFSSSLIPMRALLEDTFGKPFDTLFKEGVSLEMIAEAFEKAVGPNGRFKDSLRLAGEGVSGLTARLEENIRVAKSYVGTAFRPITEGVLKMANAITDAFRSFLDNPIGKWAVRITLLFTSLFLVLAGGYVAVMTLRLGVVALSYAFARNTQMTILNTLATRGLTAAVRKLAVAIWAATWPILAIGAMVVALVGYFYLMNRAINSNVRWVQTLGLVMMALAGPIGWIAGGIMLVRRGLREFDAVLKDGAPVRDGFIGFLQRLGGIVRFVTALWRGYNAATGEFIVPRDLVDAMDRLGLLELSQKLATWVGRVKAFWHGFKQGLLEAWKVIKAVGKAFLEMLIGPEKKLGDWNKLIGFNTDSMEKWQRIGKQVGKILVYSFTTLLVVFGAIAVSLSLLVVLGVLAFGPMIAMVAAFIWVGTKLANLLEYIFKMSILGFSHMQSGILFVLAPVLKLVEKFTELLNLMGLISKQTITPELNPNGVVAPWLNKALEMKYGVTGQPVPAVSSNSPYQYMMDAQAERNTYARVPSSSSNTTYNNTTASPNIVIPMYIDGEEVARKVIDRTELEKYLNNA